MATNHGAHGFEGELEVAIAAAREAGQAALQLRGEGVRYGHKDGWELVSEADLRAEQILHERIASAYPGDGWLSEEHTDGPSRLSRERTWIVDPIDGTREYLEGVPEYAVSVGLVVGGEPVLGVVYNPAHDELDSAICEGGTEGAERPVPAEGPTVLVGRRELHFRELPPLAAGTRVAGVGSVAYRLALLARGVGDAVATGYGRSEWDVAAGAALCAAAGLRVTDVLGEPLEFNKAEPQVRGLLVAAPALHETMLGHIERAVGSL